MLTKYYFFYLRHLLKANFYTKLRLTSTDINAAKFILKSILVKAHYTYIKKYLF